MKSSPFVVTNEVLDRLERKAHEAAVSDLVKTYRLAKEHLNYLEEMLLEEIRYFMPVVPA